MNKHPLIVAHRGASAHAPENTLAAFQMAWSQGIQAVEGDFMLSSDKRIVCHHDPHTARLAASTYLVADTPYEQLATLDVGQWFDSRYQGESIPTLEDILKTMPPGHTLYIEIKCGREILPILWETLDGFKQTIQTSQIVLIAFDPELIRLAKKQRPQYQANWLIDYYQHPKKENYLPEVEVIIDTLTSIDADGLGSENHPCLDEEFIQSVHDAGFSFHVSTVDDPERGKELAEWGVDSITSNYPFNVQAKITRSCRKCK